MKLPFYLCLSMVALVLTDGRIAKAGFSLTATAGTNTDMSSGSFAIADASFDAPLGNASAFISGALVFDGLIRARVAAGDERSFGNFGTSASVLGTWADTIRWTSASPAPSTLFINLNLDGLIEGALNPPPEGRSISGGAFVRVRDNVQMREVGVLSSGSVGLQDFSVSGRYGLRKSNFSDEYSVGFRFEASAVANEGYIVVDALNSFGFLDITLEDGTSVIDQISFDSGLEPTATNPVPEPASMSLFGLGLAGCGAIVRKRRQALATSSE